jgi:hypothetical protein
LQKRGENGGREEERSRGRERFKSKRFSNTNQNRRRLSGGN